MADNKYQGWTNAATWAVGLILDNDENLYNYIRERIPQQQRFETIDFLKETIEGLLWVDERYCGHYTMITQLLNTTMALVDWGKLADHYREE